uniref:Uncharacterized protein n=1 Tax=Romanomermis culicivorax TaxID=13658 RepID=A0A915KKQ0_ROMCU
MLHTFIFLMSYAQIHVTGASEK